MKPKFIIVTISNKSFTYNNLPIDDSVFIHSEGKIKVNFEIDLVGIGDFSTFIENGKLDEESLIHEVLVGRMQMVGISDKEVASEYIKLSNKNKCDNHDWKYIGERLDGRYVCERCGKNK
jgi:hypothetical protein